MKSSVIIHGHFYQPPRADPWLEDVPRQPTAAPFHDWNQRIESECYRAVVAARIHDADGHIARVVNTLASISFNFGPTLLEWMERHATNTYTSILTADRQSHERLGYGNAIAMPYHHPILPLCTLADKRTEVRWGIRDFEKRFRRKPIGMWLPETAVDEETLDVLAAEGIAFTILAPSQFKNPPADGTPGIYRTASGKTIALFPYDGDISHDIAFGSLLDDAAALYDRVIESTNTLVSLATDGETFGHHHKFGEMALASFLTATEQSQTVRVENFTSFLARHPASQEVELVAPSSWSCAHGVERWRANCGCKMDSAADTQQEWRTVLRESLNWLAGELHEIFEKQASRTIADPWCARDEYIEVLITGGDERLNELLEMERNVLRMFTSCGWFFDDIAGIEAVQVLRYAARAIDLSGENAERLSRGLRKRLAKAASNDESAGNGAAIYQRDVLPKHGAVQLMAAGFAMAHATGAQSPSGYPYNDTNGDGTTIRDHRTGRVYEFTISVERDHEAILTAHVGADSAPPVAIDLDDLPERFCSAIRQTMIRAITDRRLTPEEKNALLTGNTEFAHVARGALVRSLRTLRAQFNDNNMAEAEELLDLCVLHGFTVPFDAQTIVSQLLENESIRTNTRLVVLARRMNIVIS